MWGCKELFDYSTPKIMGPSATYNYEGRGFPHFVWNRLLTLYMHLLLKSYRTGQTLQFSVYSLMLTCHGKSNKLTCRGQVRKLKRHHTFSFASSLSSKTNSFNCMQLQNDLAKNLHLWISLGDSRLDEYVSSSRHKIILRLKTETVLQKTSRSQIVFIIICQAVSFLVPPRNHVKAWHLHVYSKQLLTIKNKLKMKK